MGYAIENRTIADIRRDIRDAIKALLKGEQVEGGRLFEVFLHYGTAIDAGDADHLPLVWRIPHSYTPEVIGGHKAQHNIPFEFVCVTYNSDDPEAGKDAAEDLASAVYDILMRDRSLGGRVADVIPGTIDPAFEFGGNPATFAAAVNFSYPMLRRE